MKNNLPLVFLALATIFSACGGGSKPTETKETQSMFTGAKGEVKIMTLDPGHFHAALIQKVMYDQVNPVVHIYAPDGSDVDDHLKRIEGFNTRAENPTSWESKVYRGDDFFEKMITEKPGNVMNVSGNNSKKTEYIYKTIEAGINVLADKPMVITPDEFPKLEKAFQLAEEKGVLLYDVMTERHEITTIIQRELSKIPDVFGELQEGTLENPSITKESIHHFFKYVAGNPIKRPAWFFDTEQQGEGLVDVTTHLVDLIQWEAFPEQIIKKEDIEILQAKRWPTVLSEDEFKTVTKLDAIPEFLKKDMKDGKLNVFSNGEIIYKLKGKVAKTSVTWNYQAPEGTGDTHYSTMRGSICDVIIKQGQEQGYKPTVYIKANIKEGLDTFEGGLQKAIDQDIATMYPGLKMVKLEDNLWTVEIPEKYKIGHEAHFGQVTEKYLRYLKWGHLPEWEVPNMIAKYYTTTKALEMAK